MSRPVPAETPLPRQAGPELQGVRVDSVGQAAAGGLLLAIAIVELLLGFWAVGWHQRAATLAVAAIGVAFLASGLAEIAMGRRPAGPPDDVRPERSAP